MKLIDTYQPTKLSQIIGNKQAIAKIERSILMNEGLGGLVFMLTGKTGNGKTLIADIIAESGAILQSCKNIGPQYLETHTNKISNTCKSDDGHTNFR